MNVNYAGNWNSGTSYNQGDFVVYQNVMYIALGNVLSGQLPPDINLSWELVVYGAQFGPVTPTPTVTPGLTATPTPTTSEIPVTPTPTITITPTSSEIPVTPTPTPTITITPTSSEIPVTPTPTETIGITPTPTPTELVQQLLNPIITEELDVYISVGNNEYLQFNDPSTPPTPTPTSSEIPVTPTVTITPTSSEIPVTPSATVTPTTSSLGVTPTPTPSSGATPSGFTVTIQEVGPDVVWSGSGSLNLNDLTLQNTQTITAGYSANQAIWAAGPITPTNCELWSGPSFTTYPTSFGSGGIAPTSSTGSIFGIIPGGSGRTIIVPSGYVSGSLLNGTTTYDNTTILDMGLTPGTYVWSWGTGPNADSITMIIG